MLAVALLAAGGLSHEIALTRLLSALLVTSWVGPVLAVALLGIGLGAAVVALVPGARSDRAARLAACVGALIGVLSLPAWLWAVAVGVPALGLVASLVTYVGIGIGSSAVFALHPPRAATLFRADYAAAALAALATPWLIGLLGAGAPAAMLFSALLVALAAVALSAPRDSAGRSSGTVNELALGATLLAVAAPLLAGLALAVGALRVDPAVHMAAKPVSLALARGGTVESTAWDATARTDLVRTPDGARYLYMDGGAGSLVPGPEPERWAGDVGAFAFAMAPADSAFLIGTGGGLDVAQARLHGVDDVVAVEVNPASIAMVRDLGTRAAPVYEAPTEVVIGDGRRVLAGRGESFDVITLANVVTGAAELRGAALTENRVYTVEAFETYLRHLTADGRLALKLYDELTLTRALTTALSALVRGGYAPDHTSALGHVMAVLDASTSGSVPLLVVRRSPFDLPEAVQAARVAEANGWSLLLVPELLTPDSLRPLAQGDGDLAALVAASPDIDISPTHDARPFFFAFEPGVPDGVRTAGVVAAAMFVLLFGLASIAGARLGGLDQALRSRRLLAAVMLGAAFLLVELGALPLVQAATGHPAWSLSLTLGAVLVGSAVGAHLSARGGGGAVAPAALLAAVTVVGWSLLAPPLTGLLAFAPGWLAGAVLAACLGLAAVPMGVPFPRLLTSIGRPAGVAAALALSGAASVAAGALATWTSHAVGHPAVVLAAAAAYLLAALFSTGSRAPADDDGPSWDEARPEVVTEHT